MRKLIFKESIYVSSFEDDELHTKVKSILEKEKNKGGVFRTNVGGFQTDKLKDLEIEKKLFTWAVKTLQSGTNHENVTFQFDGWWINENLHGHSNMQHIHVGSHFSAIYYIDAPKDCGRLVFHDNNDAKEVLNYVGKGFGDRDFYNYFVEDPAKNKFVIFPSFIRHSVEPNRSHEPRISVAFDLNCI